MSEESKGCSVVVVVMVAILMLVVGIAIGGGGLYFWFAQSPDSLMPADSPTVAEPTEPTEPTPKQDTKKTVSAEDAVLYPLDQTLRIEGPLDEKEVQEQLLAKRFKLRKCYQDELEKNPDLKGEMSLQFTVAGSNGKVTAAVERHTDFPDTGVRDCILDELKSWTFSGKQKSQSVVKFDILMLSMSQAVGGQ